VIVAGILLIEMIIITSAVVTGGAGAEARAVAVGTPEASNIETIGRVLYTDYIYFFQAAGIVLLIAMIGAIVLTLRHKPGVKRQKVHDQVTRDARTAMEIKGAVSGAGVSPEDLV
jgi:NADH-quinone oxidoreductase subunit J